MMITLNLQLLSIIFKYYHTLIIIEPKDIKYDKKHKRYSIFCSKECRKKYTKTHNSHYCIICGNPAKYISKNGNWLKTCGSKECRKKCLQNAQKIGVKNRNKLNISKNDLYNLFINQNKSRKNIAEYFGCSEANIKKMCRIYNISKEQNQALKNTYNTKIEKYGYGYYTNNDVISKSENQWLNEMNIPNDNKHRQKILYEYRVDGFIPEENKIYEFLGDYWHGNPNIFQPTDLNKHNDKTMGELYNNTIHRFNDLISYGYRLFYIWESDYKKGKSLCEYKGNNSLI